MSTHVDEFQNLDKPWFKKKSSWIAAAVFLFLLAAAVVIFGYFSSSNEPRVVGGLTIDAIPGTRIYIGDKLVGTTGVTFTWAELFGDEEHQPIAIDVGDRSEITAELVCGARAKELDLKSLGGGLSIPKSVSGFEFMVRRADGSLDEVYYYLFTWKRPGQPSSRFLLPLRLRNGSGETATYFDAHNPLLYTQSSIDLLKSHQEKYEMRWKFTPGTPPSKFAEEIKTKGLWAPGGER